MSISEKINKVGNTDVNSGIKVINSVQKPNKKSTFTLDFILAGVSAAIGKTATAPLERVKLILQNQISIEVIERPYAGIRDCFSRLIKSEGFFSLWRGNVPNVLRYFPNQAMNFAFKDTFKTIFCPYDPNKDFWKFALGSCFSGGLAGSISLMVCHPIDLVRTRLATDNKSVNGLRKFNGTFDCLGQIYRKEGYIGLYRGIVVSVVGIFAYRAAYFGGYDTLKSKMKKHNAGFFTKWFVAQSVTIVAGMMFYPLDTIRRRIMIETGKLDHEKKYKNAVDCFKKMYRQESVRGFYKGFATNAMKTSGSSIILVLYDEFQKFFGVEARGGLQAS
jgi:solute carrier family 25 (adenine nucleotide translocator) protein 4/5/6/31